MWKRGGQRLALLAALLLAGLLCGAAQAERRGALVIGNGAYAGAERLDTPRQDAADVRAALTELGFSVISPPTLDLSQRGLEQAVQKFAEASRDADVALFYYAGHGVGRGGEAVPLCQILPRPQLFHEHHPKLPGRHPHDPCKGTTVILEPQLSNLREGALVTAYGIPGRTSR